MPDTQTPAPVSSVVDAVAGPEPGRFDSLALFVDLVVNADSEPLPTVERTPGGIARMAFDGARAHVNVVVSGSAHAQAAYLYALGASITSLAREVEGR